MCTTNSCGVMLLLATVAFSACSRDPSDRRGEASTDRYLQELFDRPDDFQLVDKIFVRIAESCDGSDPSALSKLPHAHKVVLDVLGAEGIIGNGGFKYLFESGLGDIPGIAESYDAIGVPRAAAAVREALAIFPESKPHPDVEERLAYLEGLGPPALAKLERLSKEIWACNRETMRKLATFVRANKDTFLSLPPSRWEDITVFQSRDLAPPKPDATAKEVIRWLESIGASVRRWDNAYPDSKATAPVPTDNPIVSIDLAESRNTIDRDLELLTRYECLQSVRDLDLESSHVSSEGLTQLARLPDLRRLNLSQTDVEDAELERLAPLARLASLRLVRTSVSNAGLPRLAALKSLEQIDLSETQIDDQGLAALAAVTRLRSLGLRGTRIHGKGLRFLANLSLETLELMNSSVTNEELSSLRALRGLKSLELRDTAAGDAVLEHVSHLSLLESLNLDGTKITDRGLSNLARLTNLQSLSLSVTSLEGSGLQHLAGLTKLNDLHLYGTKCDDAGIAHLTRLPSLENLWLGETRVTDKCFASLSKLRTLKKLGIDDQGIRGGEEIRQLDQLRSLEWISLPKETKGNANVRYLQEKLRTTEFSF